MQLMENLQTAKHFIPRKENILAKTAKSKLIKILLH